MKQLLIISFSVGLLLTGCSNRPELKKDEALQLIIKQLKFPIVIDYDIYCSDPIYAKKLLDAGLEANGIVTVQKTQKLKDVGNPLIRFTDRAKPYFLPTSDKDKKLDIQKVKIAEEVITDLKILTTVDRITTVEYTTIYNKKTPFAFLLKRGSKELKKHTAYFMLSDKGWRFKKSS